MEFYEDPIIGFREGDASKVDLRSLKVPCCRVEAPNPKSRKSQRLLEFMLFVAAEL